MFRSVGQKERNPGAVIRLITGLFMFFMIMEYPSKVYAVPDLTAPSAILTESSTGKVIYEKNADEKRSPASLTKIMTLLIIFDHIDAGKVRLEDEVTVSEYASSMGGSQVYLAQGEVQTLETLIKCIAVASGNDASVAAAEFIAGSEEAFVKMMNDRADGLGMKGTHFIDCCGLTTSDEHYTTARDVSIMSGELITKYPEIFKYTGIWMEDIMHVTRQGSSTFTLSSTNKLLKRYPYATGLKTGSTQKAKYCISATASRDGMDLIAVVLGAPDPKARFSEAQTLLTYGYSACSLYKDENPPILPQIKVKGGVNEQVELEYDGIFTYFDLENLDHSKIGSFLDLSEECEAPVTEGQKAGSLVYTYDGQEIGRLDILFSQTVDKAGFADYLKQVLGKWMIFRQ